MKPLITVYITNYNYGRYVKQAIDSLLEQSYQNLQILIIDDGSTDGSKDIIEQYRSHQLIEILYQQNKGLNATNNVAISKAKGKYIMRLDADDFLDPLAIEKMVSKIESIEEACMIFPDYYNVDEQGEVINQVKRHDFDKEVSLLDQPAHGAVTLIRLKDIQEVGGYDEEFTRQDGYDLWLKLSNHKRVININEPLFYYRQHGKSITDNEEKLLSARRQIKRKHVKQRNSSELNVLAIIPVRGNQLDKNSVPLQLLGEKPLLDWTIDEALKVNEVQHTIITSPSKEVLKYAEERYAGVVLTHERDINLAKVNQRIDNTIMMVIDEYKKNHSAPDLILVLYIEAPFRNSEFIQEAIDSIKLFDVDAVEAVRPEQGILYTHDGGGLKYLQENHDLKLERNDIYKRVGGMHLMKYNSLIRNKSLNFKRTGHILLDQKSSLFISTNFDWKVAKIIAENE